MENNETHNKFLPVAVIVAGLLIAGAVFMNGSRPAVVLDGGKAPIEVDVKDIKIDGNPFLGSLDAPVTIVFWSDFQCPYCRAAEVGGIPQIPIVPAIPEIIKNYVDTGKVRLVFMDFAFLGEDSVTAGLYNRSVWALYPNQYFVWRTAMFTAQDGEGQGFGDAASIDKLTATIAGIDAKKVAADVKANEAAYRTALESDKAEAIKVGINATPSFVVGKKVIAGAQPYENFVAAIEEALK